MTDNRVHLPPLYPPPDARSGRGKVPGGGKEAAENFAQTLQKSREGLHFSAHARQRLESRRILLEPAEMQKLEEAVDKAAARGCRSSLLLYRDMAFVAGVPNRTIITAMDGQSMREHVFTNIDSAVVVE